jgi:hypothetical protein
MEIKDKKIIENDSKKDNDVHKWKLDIYY